MKRCTCQKRQDGAIENKNTKPKSIDTGEVSNNYSESIKLDESDNRQINQQTLFLNQSSDYVRIVEFNEECGSPFVNIHAYNSEGDETSDQNENSFYQLKH